MCYTYFELSSPVRTHYRNIVEHKDVGGIYSDTTLGRACHYGRAHACDPLSIEIKKNS